MKKTILTLAACLIAVCSFLSVSCVSTGASDPELFIGNTYKLTTITFRTDISVSNKEDALKYVENLPVEEIKQQIFDTYNITLDTTVFNHDYLSENLKAQVATNKAGQETNLGWIVEYPEYEGKTTEEVQALIDGTAQIVMNLYTMNSYSPGLTVLTGMYNNAKEVLPYAYTDKFWTPVPVTANKETAAILEFSKYIQPAYLIIDDQAVTYAAYSSANSAGNSSIYVDTDKEVKVNTIVNDPGIFMLYDPATFVNCIIEGEYEAGKTYSVKHKVTDRLQVQSKWKVEFEFEEK